MNNKPCLFKSNFSGVKCKFLFTFLFLVFLCNSFVDKAMAAGEKAFFVYSSDGSTITLKWGTDYASGTQLNNTGSNFPYNHIGTETYPDVTKIVIEAGFENYKPSDLKFAGYTNLKEIQGIQYLNTENYTSFFRMFYNCSSLENLDLSSFNTAKLEYMHEMFNGCTSLKTVKLNGPNFTTSQVTKMNIMFLNCKSLETVDLSGFDTQSCEDMSAMFHRCEKLESIVFPTSMNTTKLNNIEGMFRDCKSLKYLDMKGFGMMSKVNNFKNVFNGCESLVVLDISNYFAYVSYMYGIFDDCKSLTTILVQPNGFKIEYLNTTWNQNYSSTYFGNCDNLIGDKGTTFESSGRNASSRYAKIDDPQSNNPGYFTTGNYKVFYELNGGTNNASNPDKFDIVLSSDITIQTPTKIGYKFRGWTGTSASGISNTTPETNVKIAAGSMGNRIYTAHWSIINYTLTYDLDGGDWAAADQKNPISYDVNFPEYHLRKPVKTGYTFDGWFDGQQTVIDYVIGGGAVGSKDFIAKWKINQYTISFDTKGGSAIADIKQDYATAITKPADPTKEHYTFVGWDQTIPATMPATDMVLSAKWKANSHTITFDTKGGSEIAPMTVEYNAEVTPPANPTKPGYTFVGWDKDIPTTMPDEDLTFTAQWKANPYTITFDTDGGSEIAPITQEYNTPVTAPAAPVKKGFSFLGWKPELPATMPAENITVVAQWKDNREQIAVDINGEVSFPADHDKYCDGSEKAVTLPYTISAGKPTNYTITFYNQAIATITGTVDDSHVITIDIPETLESGVYKGSIVFSGDPTEYRESEPYAVTITANIPKLVAYQLYTDMLIADNSSNTFKTYQWYKDGNAIAGAQSGYLYEQTLSGKYTVKIATTDGKEFMSCPVKLVSTKALSQSVNVYPNPAKSGEKFTVEILGYQPDTEYSIMLFSSNGSLVKKLSHVERLTEISLPFGVYSGSLISGGPKTGFKLIVK